MDDKRLRREDSKTQGGTRSWSLESEINFMVFIHVCWQHAMLIMEETQPDVLWEFALSRKLFYKYKNILKITFS